MKIIVFNFEFIEKLLIVGPNKKANHKMIIKKNVKLFPRVWRLMHKKKNVQREMFTKNSAAAVNGIRAAVCLIYYFILIINNCNN